MFHHNPFVDNFLGVTKNITSNHNEIILNYDHNKYGKFTPEKVAKPHNTIEAFENSKEIRKKAHENHGSNQNTTNNISEDVPMVLDDGKQKNALTNWSDNQNKHKVSEDTTTI